nr:immunoglobulin heavy chain junction region [Macaca mulatta]MOV54110.1 immunoglobulin heavy chain junction region [Macaca mulatta]MOV55497.1 immunoglobulin heavy chain junction region [Macaca mulatta]MOV56074.1 immunoglobulin heavy chain junction region [Macaca mulatta]MOV57241.1 immunoglobulin heavy chain junction region [Macaca mulatta]
CATNTHYYESGPPEYFEFW